MSIEDIVREVVREEIRTELAPYLKKLVQPEPLVYSVREVAVLLQVSVTTIKRLLDRGDLPTVPKIEGRVLIPRVAIEALLDSGITIESP